MRQTLIAFFRALQQLNRAACKPAIAFIAPISRGEIREEKKYSVWL